MTHDEMTPMDLFDLFRERRGLSFDQLREMEDPRHARLMDLDRLIEALHDARMHNKRVVVHPDFDVDGITSGTIALAALAELGFTTGLHVPNYQQGHDFSADDAQEIRQAYPDAYAVLTTDTGINAHAGVAAAQEMGMQVWITDHHIENHDRTTADIIVNPSRHDETYALKGICGAHVILQVVLAYTERYQPRLLGDIEMLRVFAGIGTVADVMPLVKENRKLVRDSLSIARLFRTEPTTDEYGQVVPRDPNESTGMQVLRVSAHHHPLYLSAFEGLGVVLAEFAARDKLRGISSLDEGFYAWYLAPAFNSIRRVEGQMHDAFTVFFGSTLEAKQEACRTVLDGNDRRKELSAQYLQEMLESDDQVLAPSIWFSDAPAGMFGLLAARVMENTGRPVVVVRRPADDADENTEIGGSARSPAWFDLNSAVNAAGFTAIGHEQACGVRVTGHEQLVELAGFLETEGEAAFAAAEAADEIADAVDIRLGDDATENDAPANGELLAQFTVRLDALRPFGYGIPEPAIQVNVPAHRCSVRRIGSQNNHLMIKTSGGVKMLLWNADEELMERMEHMAARETRTLSFVGSPKLSSFNGVLSADLVLRGIDL